MKIAQISTFFLVAICCGMLSSCVEKQTEKSTKPPVDYVDPFIGTDFFGHTFPGPTLPYAMVQLSPDNDTEGWTYSSGYSYSGQYDHGFQPHAPERCRLHWLWRYTHHANHRRQNTRGARPEGQYRGRIPIEI
jgi:putative alpha-1,2-mannosidase